MTAIGGRGSNKAWCRGGDAETWGREPVDTLAYMEMTETVFCPGLTTFRQWIYDTMIVSLLV